MKAYLKNISSTVIVLFSTLAYSNPMWVANWSNGCHSSMVSAHEKSLGYLKKATENASKNVDQNVSLFMKGRLNVEMGSIFENQKKWEEARLCYSFVVSNKRLKNSVTYVNALRGMIRCNKSLGEDCSQLEISLEKLCPSTSAVYLASSTLLFVPFVDRIDNGLDSVKKSIKEIFDIESADSVLNSCVRTYSGALILDLSEEFLRSLNDVSNKKHNNKDALIKFIKSKLESGLSPLLFPSNNDLKLLSYHPKVLDSNIEKGVLVWAECARKLSMPKFCSNSHEGISLIQKALSIISGKSHELESRLLVELGMFLNDSENIKKALEAFTLASRFDKFGLTRTTLTAICFVLESAVVAKEFSLVIKSFKRAERLYIQTPKILGMYGNCLIVESCRDDLEKIPSLLSNKNIDIKSIKVPSGISYGPSKHFLLWEDFDNQISSMSGAGLMIKTWKSMNSIFSVFKSKKQPTPRNQGVIGLFLGDESKPDDI